MQSLFLFLTVCKQCAFICLVIRTRPGSDNQHSIVYLLSKKKKIVHEFALFHIFLHLEWLSSSATLHWQKFVLFFCPTTGIIKLFSSVLFFYVFKLNFATPTVIFEPHWDLEIIVMRTIAFYKCTIAIAQEF